LAVPHRGVFSGEKIGALNSRARCAGFLCPERVAALSRIKILRVAGFRIPMESQDAEEWSITLPPEMARMIREKVSSGAYGSDSEVIREALRGWLERDRRLTALDSAVARGVADAAAGRVHGFDEVQGELRERFLMKG
jgi:antitoxin ParD1/3/4